MCLLVESDLHNVIDSTVQRLTNLRQCIRRNIIPMRQLVHCVVTNASLFLEIFLLQISIYE